MHNLQNRIRLSSLVPESPCVACSRSNRDLFSRLKRRVIECEYISGCVSLSRNSSVNRIRSRGSTVATLLALPKRHRKLSFVMEKRRRGGEWKGKRRVPSRVNRGDHDSIRSRLTSGARGRCHAVAADKLDAVDVFTHLIIYKFT